MELFDKYFQKCDNSLSVCVCGWAKYHFISGEPAYDDDHVGDGEAWPFSGKCFDRCDIGAWGF